MLHFNYRSDPGGTSLPVLSPQILSAISTCRDTKMKCWCRSFCITLLFQPIHSLVNLPGSARTNRSFFTVALNKAVPLLYNALASGEMLPKVELHWWRTSVEGKQEHYFTTRLTDATIVDMNLHMPHCRGPLHSVSLRNCSQYHWHTVRLSGSTSNPVLLVPMTGVHRWKHKSESTTSCLRAGCCFCTCKK